MSHCLPILCSNIHSSDNYDYVDCENLSVKRSLSPQQQQSPAARYKLQSSPPLLPPKSVTNIDSGNNYDYVDPYSVDCIEDLSVKRALSPHQQQLPTARDKLLSPPPLIPPKSASVSSGSLADKQSQEYYSTDYLQPILPGWDTVGEYRPGLDLYSLLAPLPYDLKRSLTVEFKLFSRFRTVIKEGQRLTIDSDFYLKNHYSEFYAQITTPVDSCYTKKGLIVEEGCVRTDHRCLGFVKIGVCNNTSGDIIIHPHSQLAVVTFRPYI